ncbi:MAG TPA: hypothetical protein VKV26_02165 [Dehalococcoidia bacterium]|nr:hypothetical protein [Dehalococcoidia bacterium]
MANANTEITIQGRGHRSAPVTSSRSPSSPIPATRSPESAREHTLLEAFGLITLLSGKTWRIHGMHVEDRTLPDIDVRASRVVSTIGFEAMLGLSFPANFSEVCCQRPSAMLTLRR